MNSTIKLFDIFLPHLNKRIFDDTLLDYSYLELGALKRSEPDSLLLNNPLARQVTRALLDSNDWIRFAGNEIPEGEQPCNAARFPSIKTREIYLIVYKLRRLGFFDFYKYDPVDEGGVGFLSEFYMDRTSCYRGGFELNNLLREEIRKFISPFENEEIGYIIPKRICL
jgi:hypothetical protein